MIGTRRQKLHNEPLIILHVEKAALSRHMKAKHVLTMTPDATGRSYLSVKSRQYAKATL